MPRPPFCPTDEQRRAVAAMVSYGIPQVDIARVVGIDDETLRKHFREEIDTGAAKANARVAEFLFEQATGQRGDGSAAVTAAIFWAKTRMRWKETVVNEHQIEPRDATLEERQAAAKALLDEAFGGQDPDAMEGNRRQRAPDRTARCHARGTASRRKSAAR